ncbi:juvenile hormone esterase-like [Topomyia yanbarensis]|uniref:juvenile hormone esterase-like n=1 Tax=Topomyia yanbarensis TaxID=2498891 RepID=UPI00273C2FED|nr:juvenile hormone esterase-like [Topomyia yanbarensis]
MSAAGSKNMFKLLLLILKLVIAFVQRLFEDIYIQHWPGLERPIVQVKQGKVQGVTSKLPNGTLYHLFKGIPYAKPPIGELRFCSPVPLERFTTPLLKCLVDRSQFIQPHEVLGNYWIAGTEDALFLNIYTPQLPVVGTKEYAVMVYIHGGGLKQGTASSFIYDPRYFVQKGVVVVVMSYRLGPFGFLSIPSVGISGNFGLKDQRLALRWIQENIESFGGNPKNVTLFGESAGSWSAYLHYLSANSRKYFHRVICQSGDACTESVLQVDPTEKARRLARCLGYKGNSDQGALDILRRTPARRLIKYQDAAISEQEIGLPLQFLFRPVIELELNEDTILNQSPELTLKSFDTIQMPIIQGYTSGEGILTLCLNKNRLWQFDQHPEWLIPQLIGNPVGLNKTTVGEGIKQFYCKGKQICWKTSNEISDLFSDLTFLTTSNLSAEWLAKFQPNAPQYHYLFSYDGRFSIVKRLLNVSQIEGTSHADDCFYMFSPPFLPALSADSDEIRVRDTLVELWTNFAKYSDPTPDTSGLCFKWLPVTKVDPETAEFDLDCLDINVRPRMVRNPYPERIEFWRKLIKRYTNLI